MNQSNKVNFDKYLTNVVKTAMFSNHISDDDDHFDSSCVSAIVPTQDVHEDETIVFKDNTEYNQYLWDNYPYGVVEIAEVLEQLGVGSIRIVSSAVVPCRGEERKITTVVPIMDDFDINAYRKWLKYHLAERLCVYYPNQAGVFVEFDSDLFSEDENELPCPTGSVDSIMAELVGSVFNCKLYSVTYFEDIGLVNPMFKFVIN